MKMLVVGFYLGCVLAFGSVVSFITVIMPRGRQAPDKEHPHRIDQYGGRYFDDRDWALIQLHYLGIASGIILFLGCGGTLYFRGALREGR